jgi:hypothetical protein
VRWPLKLEQESPRHSFGVRVERHGARVGALQDRAALQQRPLEEDDYAGSQPARRGTDPLGRGDGALGQVVPPGASHDVGDHQGREGTKNPRADAIEHLDADSGSISTAPATRKSTTRRALAKEQLAVLASRPPPTQKKAAPPAVRREHGSAT